MWSSCQQRGGFSGGTVLTKKQDDINADDNNTSDQIQRAAKQVFEEIQSKTSDVLEDEKKFLKGIDAAYTRLLFQIRIVLRRKRFHKIILGLLEKYRETSHGFT